MLYFEFKIAVECICDALVLFEHILRASVCSKDMAGMKVLVTAGPTQEALDPVRYLTNHSSGKMYCPGFL